MKSNYLILKVVKLNWSMPGPGQWKKTIWHIYSDGSYVCEYHEMPFLNEDPVTSETGNLDISEIEAIKELIKKTWPETHRNGHDGTGWNFIAYDAEGNIIKETEYGYIYGVGMLEQLAELLPCISEQSRTALHISFTEHNSTSKKVKTADIIDLNGLRICSVCGKAIGFASTCPLCGTYYLPK